MGSLNLSIFWAAVTKMQHMFERKNSSEQQMVLFGISNPSIENPTATTVFSCTEGLVDSKIDNITSDLVIQFNLTSSWS